MIAVSPSPLVRRISTVVAALALGTALTACSEAVLAVEDSSVKSAGEGSAAPTAAATPTPAAALDPALEATPLPLGPFSLNLPLGWAAIDGAAGVAGGATSTAQGAGTYTAAPAAGKDQATWVSDMLAGTTTVVVEREGLVQNPDVVTADGTTMFHITHTYSENRAHIFGLVADDQLHMIRFGLDGTIPTSDVITKAVATAVYAPVTASAPASVPAPTTPAASITP